MATIADVARLAQVSTATVSRVLNGKAAVDPELTTRVRQAIDTLGYRPSRLARSLRKRASPVWAVIIPDIRNPFFTDMVRGIEDVAYSSGYSLVLCNAEEDVAKETTYLTLAIDEHMAGIVLAPASNSPVHLQDVRDAGIPIVTVDRRLGTADDEINPIDRVMIDNAGGAALAVDHLWEKGFRRIACITGPAGVSTADERLEGFRSGLAANGVTLDPLLVRYGDFHEQSGLLAMRELLALPEPPEAVFVANNLMTLGALDAIAASGLLVPQDVAVVGFDDMSWASLLRPPLTTVGQPTYQVGAQTAQMLLSRIGGFTGPSRETVLPTDLFVRASSQRE